MTLPDMLLEELNQRMEAYDALKRRKELVDEEMQAAEMRISLLTQLLETYKESRESAAMKAGM